MAFSIADTAQDILKKVFDSTALALKVTSAIAVASADTPTIYNTTMTLANTEYSQALPSHTKQFEFRCRGNFDVRFAYVTGKVAGPTAPYRTLAAGQTKGQEGLDTDITLYVACAQAAQVVELEVWT